MVSKICNAKPWEDAATSQVFEGRELSAATQRDMKAIVNDIHSSSTT